MRVRLGVLLGVGVLSGCVHHGTLNPAPSSGAATVQTDSDLTGEPPPAAATPAPTYPRATLVALPAPAPPPSPVTPAENPAPIPVAAVPSESTPVPAPAPESAPAAAPLETATTTPLPITAAPPEAAAPGASRNDDANTTPLPITPPPPVVATRPPTAMDDAEAQKQVVVLVTSLGNLVIELDDVSAPRTCGNFRKLVSDGFYNHTTFHRVLPHFIIQGGDPNTKSDDRATYGQGDPGYTLPAEIKLKHVAGAVAMARLPDSVNPQRDSNGSQFFICVAPCPSLDDQYTVFGHVIAGMETADKIAHEPRDSSDDPVTRIEMQASLETKKQALENAAP
jgi:peptidyl-prolyl cis-trans isomerase B (cyclophilin B)